MVVLDNLEISLVKTFRVYSQGSRKEYVKFFASSRMIGNDGPLSEYGLVPMPKNEYNDLQKLVKGM